MPRKKKEIATMIKQAKQENWTSLDLKNCPLTDFIDEVCQMAQLEELDLTHCHLTILPDAIGNLSNLKKLTLAENQLDTLPETICNLQKIEYLDLTLNNLRKTSQNVLQWIKSIPSYVVSNTEIERLIKEPEVIVKCPKNPNAILKWLEEVLTEYGSALSADDHNADGDSVRERADKTIADIFRGIPELKEVLSDFYKDFQEKKFYYCGQESEKTLKQNPFKLPINKDIKWLAENKNQKDKISYCLSLKTTETKQRVRFIRNGEEFLITYVAYGSWTLSNQPYAEDIDYFANYTANLYRVGQERFYVKLIETGLSDATSWYVSEDGGKSWSKQPYFLHEFLDVEKEKWILLSSV
jgi:hypothetical protein